MIIGAKQHATVTLSGTPDYITLVGQDIVRGQIDLTADVTGVLPDANVANDITLTNITQITNRSHTNLSDIGTNAHSAIDTHIAGTLAEHAATTSLELAGVISNETGSGALVFATSPTFTTQITTPKIVATSNSLAILPTTDATTAIQLQNAAGTSILNVDTTNSRVGIGTTSPGNILGVSSTGSTLVDIYGADTGQSGFNVGVDTDNRWAFFQQTAANNRNFWIYERHSGVGGDNAARLVIESGGNVGIGDTTPINKLSVLSADNTTAMNVGINATSANITTADTFIAFTNSTDVVIGSIAGTATSGLIAYNTFTGGHYVQLKDEAEKIETGMIVVATGELIKNDGVEYLPFVTKSTKRQEKAVFGVFSGKVAEPCENKHTEEDIIDYDEKGNIKVIGKEPKRCPRKNGLQHTCEYAQGDNKKALYQVYGLGTGIILVTDTNGNIEVGDYIQASDTAGYGEKQDDDILHSYSVAKATEAVDWSKETKKVKMIACTYHAS